MKPRTLLLLAALWLLAACSKKDTNPAPAPAPTPTPVVSTPFTRADNEDLVLYEVNTPAFSASRNINGVTARLDAIKSLGVNTLWTMPIQPVGQVNSIGSPYCVRDYYGVNPSLGNLNDLKNLVNGAHARGMAVILDWVANHTSWDHPWLAANPQWYTQVNGQVVSPQGTGWNDVADLNYANTDMRQAMISAMKYWVQQAGVDGFRCDAADYVPADFWQQAIDSLRRVQPRLIMLAEGARADHFSAGFDLNFSWNYLGALYGVFHNGQNASNLFTASAAEWSTVPAGKRKLRFITNHDEMGNSTPATSYGGPTGALAAEAATLFLPGNPLLYGGQEVGVPSNSVYTGGTIDWNANPATLQAYTKLMAAYSSSDAARRGTLQTYPDNNVLVYTRGYNTQQLLVLVNTRNSVQTVSLDAALAGSWNNALESGTLTVGSSMTLQPYQYVVLKK
ncbi:alpha-amylase family glycosyl hydrolase [Flaviaesturariibacter aridisoli]|nr:alpha-amylase family glycosyl hydrolase [Flaviaesturariibacter aridisoli]